MSSRARDVGQTSEEHCALLCWVDRRAVELVGKVQVGPDAYWGISKKEHHYWKQMQRHGSIPTLGKLVAVDAQAVLQILLLALKQHNLESTVLAGSQLFRRCPCEQPTVALALCV